MTFRFLVTLRLDINDVAQTPDFMSEIMSGGMYMLQIRNLTITHLKDTRILLDKFNLIIYYIGGFVK